MPSSSLRTCCEIAAGLTFSARAARPRFPISANIVAAYYHDHVFVPVADAEHALAVLRTLQAEAAALRYGTRPGGC